MGHSLGTVNSCHVTGSVSGDTTVGGLAGAITGGTVTNSFAAVTVTGQNNVGGLVGTMNKNDNTTMPGTVNNSFATGEVKGNVWLVGGLVGFNSRSTVNNSFATGKVTRTGGTYEQFGSFCGRVWMGSITNSYSTGSVVYEGATNPVNKGFVGEVLDSGTFTNNFFDSEASSQSSAIGASAKTTAEMQTQSTFTDAGWDFATTPVWQMSSAITFGGYPTLAWTRSYAVEPPLAGGLYQYQVENLAHLVWIAEDSGRWANTYLQTADIEASITAAWAGGQGWTPIGNGGTSFSGIFDGGGHMVSGLFINRLAVGAFYQGMFGILGNGATIQNLGLTNVLISGDQNVGALVAINDGTVTRCFATGKVSGQSNVGGLVGVNEYGKTISNSFATSSVTATIVSAGGLVGSNIGTLSNCYAAGAVSGSTHVGGLVGYNGGTVNNAFYDTETTGQSDTGKGIPKTTAELQTTATFSAAAWPIVAGWSTFSPPDPIWGICPGVNSGYPFLLWQHGTNPCASSTASGSYFLIPNPNGNPVIIYLE